MSNRTSLIAAALVILCVTIVALSTPEYFFRWERTLDYYNSPYFNYKVEPDFDAKQYTKERFKEVHPNAHIRKFRGKLENAQSRAEWGQISRRAYSSRNTYSGWFVFFHALAFAFLAWFFFGLPFRIKRWQATRELDHAVHNNRGIRKSKGNRAKEAIADFDMAIDLNPDDARVYDNRGWARAQAGQFDEALADYGKSIELDPEFATAYFHRGLTKAILGQFKESLADYKKAIALKPDFAAAYAAQAVPLHQVGRVDDARESLRKGLFLANNQKDKAVITEIGVLSEQLELKLY